MCGTQRTNTCYPVDAFVLDAAHVPHAPGNRDHRSHGVTTQAFRGYGTKGRLNSQWKMACNVANPSVMVVWCIACHTGFSRFWRMFRPS